MLTALGQLIHRHRWLIIGGWCALVVTAITLGGRVFDQLAPVDEVRAAAESRQAQRQIDQLTGGGPVILAVVAGRDVYDPPLVASVSQVHAQLQALPGVREVADRYHPPGGPVSADNHSLLIRVELADELPEPVRERTEDRISTLLHSIDAPRVLVGGETLAQRAFAEQALRDVVIGESVALVVLMLLLVLVLGRSATAAVPLLAALAAVAGTLLGLLGLARVLPIGEFTVNVVTLLGIGLAVDYALLLIFRFREERARQPYADPSWLLGRTVATAGRAVLAAGLGVSIAMTGLGVLGEPLLATMALGGALVAVAATITGLTLVPALIAVTHRPAPPLAAQPSAGRATARLPSTWLVRLAGFAQRRPAPVVVLCGGGLLLLALPFLAGANLANSDVRALPRSMEVRQLDEALTQDFPDHRAEPVTVVVAADPGTVAVRDLMNQLLRMPGVAGMQPRDEVPSGSTVIDLIPVEPGTGPATRELVRQVRALDAPYPMLVGGAAAELVDYRDSVAARLPLSLLVLALGTALLLFALTGSVVIPVKALLLTALTLLASLGVVVLVFQWGFGAGLIGVEPWGALDVTTPLLLFVFVFGLTTDYEVFLLDRITQRWRTRTGVGRQGRADRSDAGWGAGDRSGEGLRRASDRAVLLGIGDSGRVVTVAAACLGVVFLGFLLGELTAVKEIGFGMLVAVVLDVTLVRGLLLPAVMSLLGSGNWWRPGRGSRW